MNSDRPSTKRIVWTFIGWGLGFVAMIAAVVGVASMLTPKAPTTAPAAETSSAVVPTVAPAMPAPQVVPTSTPAPSVPATTTTPTVTTPARKTSDAGDDLAGKVVAIDAGHQFKGDPSLEPVGPGSKTTKAKVSSGATGVATHNTESSVNLAVALKLRDLLVARGARVVMIRTTQKVNISNSRRAQIANDAHADLFIRLHCNGTSSKLVNGLTTLVPATNKWTKGIVTASRRAGGFVQAAAIAATRAHDLHVTSRGDLSGFNWSKVPTVLVEMGFLSNPAEDRKLGSSVYQERLAGGLATGIGAYLKSH
jgi:N-acetylmuramoyl-L-alanine amidase